MWTVASYVLGQRLRGRKRYPLVLMLEPLFRCNLACAGCGKIQYPAHVLKQNLTPDECFRAVEECGAPMVSIPGGEPLMHPQIAEIVAGLVARKKYIYLCTNALLLREKLDLFTPSKYLTFSVHMDGERDQHDFSVCREGGFDLALDGMREALRRGFRVTTNTTLFDGADPTSVRSFFDQMMDLGVEGMMLSPGYSYDKAPDQKHFLGRARTRRLFRAILSIPSYQHCISTLLQYFVQHLSNAGIILYQQNGLTTISDHRVIQRHLFHFHFRLRFNSREVDGERAPLTKLALHLDDALMLLDDAINH